MKKTLVTLTLTAMSLAVSGPAGAAITQIAPYVQDPGFEGPHATPNEGVGTNLNGWKTTMGYWGTYQDAGKKTFMEGPDVAPAAAEGASYYRAFTWDSGATTIGLQMTDKTIPLVPGNIYALTFKISCDSYAYHAPMKDLAVSIYGEDNVRYGVQTWSSATTPVSSGTWTTLEYSITYTGTATQYGALDFSMDKQSQYNGHSSLYIDALSVPEPAALSLLALGALGLLHRRRR